MEDEVKVAVTIQEGDLTIKKGHNNSYLESMLKIPLVKKIKVVRLLRLSIIEESRRRKIWEMTQHSPEWKKAQRECKELSDDLLLSYYQGLRRILYIKGHREC
jgi:hypothetical protein